MKIKHILLIDELDKLNIKKDSSLMMAMTLKEMGYSTYLLFSKDFYIENDEVFCWNVYDFEGHFFQNNYYIDHFKVNEKIRVSIDQSTIVHFRPDPPFDLNYLKILWMLTTLENRGIKVINSPKGILCYNEKLTAYESGQSLSTYVGKNFDSFIVFSKKLSNKEHEEIIIKPLNSFQGQDVHKYHISHFLDEKNNKGLCEFEHLVKKLEGDLLVQPFANEIYKGEIRTIFYRGQEIGTILKTPSPGNYLANIVQGANFISYQLTTDQRNSCENISKRMFQEGIDLVAFDLIDHFISEINITCPGLLVETSVALNENLAQKITNIGFGRPK